MDNDDGIYRGPARFRNHRDPLTSFRWFINRAASRAEKLGVGDLTAEYLQQVWKAQLGICPITGWPMYLPVGSRGFSGKSKRNASLDRTDNSKGYVEGNVRFVCLMANIARSDFTDTDVVEFAHAVAEKHPKENFDFTEDEFPG